MYMNNITYETATYILTSSPSSSKTIKLWIFKVEPKNYFFFTFLVLHLFFLFSFCFLFLGSRPFNHWNAIQSIPIAERFVTRFYWILNILHVGSFLFSRNKFIILFCISIKIKIILNNIWICVFLYSTALMTLFILCKVIMNIFE